MRHLLETWSSRTMLEVSVESCNPRQIILIRNTGVWEANPEGKCHLQRNKPPDAAISVCICCPRCEDAGAPSGGDSTYWPSSSVLTARLRRLITASQRFTKSRQIMQIHQSQSQTQQPMMLAAPLYPLPPAVNDVLNPKMAAKIERQQRSERRDAPPRRHPVSCF